MAKSFSDLKNALVNRVLSREPKNLKDDAWLARAVRYNLENSFVDQTGTFIDLSKETDAAVISYGDREVPEMMALLRKHMESYNEGVREEHNRQVNAVLNGMNP